VAVLALCGPLIQYATVLKQYSSDVAVSAGLLLLVARGRTLALIAGGVIAMWLSDPAPIVLAGIGVLWLHQILRPRSPADRYAKIAGLLTWVASAILLFLVHARHVAAHPAYQDYWGHAYAPFPPRDAQDWSWYADSVAELLRQAGLPTWPGALALIAGIAALVTWRRWRILALALVPVILAYLLSMASVFPFSDRMLLFLVPSLALLVGAGAMVPIELPWRRSMPFARHRRAAAITLQVAAVASLFVTNVPTSIHLWREPYCKSELRQATRRLREQREPADLVYAGARATQPYEYYALDHPQAPRCFSGKPAELLREIREKGSQRVWLLFLTGSASTERQRNGMLAHMDRIGRCEQQWGRRRTWLYLYRVGKQQ
jgi:hypothetical protein